MAHRATQLVLQVCREARGKVGIGVTERALGSRSSQFLSHTTSKDLPANPFAKREGWPSASLHLKSLQTSLRETYNLTHRPRIKAPRINNIYYCILYIIHTALQLYIAYAKANYSNIPSLQTLPNRSGLPGSNPTPFYRNQGQVITL